MTVSFTTDLPDASGLLLDASNPESLTATWEDALNNGEYRIELRDDDPDGDHPPYQHEATVGYQTFEYVIDGILGGEQYSVRIRSQTDHKTGSWLSAEEITKLLGSDSVSVDSVSTTSVTLSWTINNDFRGSHQLYRRRTDYDYDVNEWRLVESFVDDAASGVDETAQPDREYEYLLRTRTQWQYADSPETVTATTDSVGLKDRAVPPRGWYAEANHPSGTTLTPQILDDATLLPRLNALPEARIPIPKGETYLDADLEGAAMRVWKDGDRRPVGEIEEVSVAPGRDELVGIGGTQLERRVQEDVIAEPAHDLAERLVEEYTDYAAHVDPPESEVTQALAQNPASADEWHNVTEFTPLDEIPIGVTDAGEITIQDSNVLLNISNETLYESGTGSPISSPDHIGQNYLTYQNRDDYDEFGPFEIDYQISGADLRIAAYLETESDPAALEAALIDHETDAEIGRITLVDTTTESGLLWYTSDGSDSSNLFDNIGTEPWTDGDVGPGTYRLRIDVAFEFEGAVDVSGVSIHDTQYVYEWDNDVDNEGGIDYPQTKPDFESVVLDAYQAVLSVRGGDLDIDIDDTGGQQSVGLSNDGLTFVRESNSATVSAEFADLTGELFVELGLSRYGDAGTGAIPRYGTEGQTVDSYELTALLDDTPIILNRNFDGDLKDILATIAEDSDSLYEVRQDGDQTVVEWAQPGQRTAGSDPAVQPDYEVTKESRRILKAIVKGGRARVEDESIVAESGTAVVLEETDVIAGTERVRSADNGTQYRPNLDYQLRTGAGELDIPEAGGIDAGEELVVDYDYNVSGSYEHPDFDGDPRTEIVEDIPQASSERACTQASRALVDELSEPRYEADVTIPAGEEISGLIETLDLEDIPGDAMVVYDVKESPDGLQLRLGSRNRVDETVQRMQSRLEATSERV
ncbi:fibronectin type III domain-containing protein [Natrinema salifodinae]|uniref:Fibronectin type-III domain-containing protein n=1 Tax=Natrinema salifodinae TaxID=1202768 RepID=A0A1I0P7P4_9EURY|nr:fibronectin type III domain-containing protein [Natrinema salifodinae]SEW10217.1 hypothetical protein SAMN05216285_2237 [Natrinema salifodinae]